MAFPTNGAGGTACLSGKMNLNLYILSYRNQLQDNYGIKNEKQNDAALRRKYWRTHSWPWEVGKDV